MTESFRRRMFSVLLCFFLAPPGRAQAPVPPNPPPFELYKGEDPPFWKKEAVQKRLQTRELIISVTSDERKAAQGAVFKQLFLKGVGRIAAPFAAVEKKIFEYERLKELSPEHFRAVVYDAGKNRLYLHGVAMGWHAKMTMQLHTEKIAPGRTRLHWKVISGSFLGLVGYFDLEDLEAGTAAKDGQRRGVEFSMTGFYESVKLPLPSFLLRFGLEAVMRIVAKRMRDFLEKSEPKSEPNKSEPNTKEPEQK